MATTLAEAPLVVIVGPTASGKSQLAIELAEVWSGEIICADSRTIYKGMDIGTAKPSPDDQRRVPHWGLDLVEPGERFSAADFKQYANQKIAEIRARGNVPFLVGGTGLYVDSVILDYQFQGPVDRVYRETLESKGVEELYEYCTENNIALPENYKNKRYIVRAIERGAQQQQGKADPGENTIVVGIATDKEVLRARIAKRAHDLFMGGAVDEAHRLARRYGWESEAMTGNIYRVVREGAARGSDLATMEADFSTLDWRLAKRQMTWFKRRTFIRWCSLDDARVFLDEALAAHR